MRRQYVFIVQVNNGKGYRESTLANNAKDAKLNVLERVHKWYSIFITDVITVTQVHPKQ